MTRCSEKALFYLAKKINSTISKTFYTCYTELLFLKYWKISKRAVKIGGFLQYSLTYISRS